MLEIHSRGSSHSLESTVIVNSADEQMAGAYNSFKKVPTEEKVALFVSGLVFGVSTALIITFSMQSVGVVLVANFALNIPLLLSIVGCGTSTLIFTLFLIRNRDGLKFNINSSSQASTVYVINQNPSLQQGARALLQPGLAANDIKDFEKLRKTTLSVLGDAQVVEFTTRDGIKLEAIWKELQGPGSTAIIFHGNGMLADHMRDVAVYYQGFGMNVLLVNVRGYGNSDKKESSELGFYYDAEAALKFVIDQGKESNKVIAHGYSMGGILATALGYYYNVPVILDHTLTSFAEVVDNVVPVPKGINDGVAAGAFPEGIPAEQFPGWEPLETTKVMCTDGCNNLQKTQRMEAEIFIIQGDSDLLMNKEFGEKFYAARYLSPNDKKEEHLVTIEGGTHTENLFYQNDAAKDKLQQFLLNIEIIHEQ